MKKMLSLGKLPIYLLLLCVFFTISCKRDTYTPDVKKHLAHESPIKKITYNEFLRSVDLNQLGILKEKFKSDGQSPGRIMSIGDQNFLSNLKVYTDSIQKLETETGTSYIFSMPVETPRSVSFRNLTIHVGKNKKTNAFITTYTPSRKWINEWKKKNFIKYEGDVSFAPLRMNAFTIKEALNSDKGGVGKLMSAGSKEMVAMNCENYSVTTFVAFGCSRGNHMPWDETCVWNQEGANVPSGDFRGGYTSNTVVYTICTTFDPGYGGGGGDGGGGGGGGGSSPNPDPNYDPCDGGGPPVAVSYVPGTKLMGVPPGPCDGVDPNPPVVTPILSYEQSTLLGNPTVNQDYSIEEFIKNNVSISVALHDFLTESGYSYESQIAAAMTIKASIYGQLGISNPYTHYSAVSSVLPPNSQNLNNVYFQMYMTMQCAIIRSEHPEYSDWRVYWEASQEIVHLLLDGVGLIPVVGEVADLANGAIYLIQGDGVNATLSFASAIPVAGWWAAGLKVAKKTLPLGGTAKTTLKWVAVAGDVVTFGNRSQLRNVLKLATGDLRQAHHIIPWGRSGHKAIQKAAKSKNAFHLNEVLNGIPLNTSVHQGSHGLYDARVLAKLEAIPTHYSPEKTYTAVLDIISDIRTAINANPTTHINQLIF